MKRYEDLPVVKNRKKIDLKKFKLLAKKVRESFEEEEKYLYEKVRRNENNNSARFLPNT